MNTYTFDQPVTLQYLDIHYGAEERDLFEAGIYSIECKDDGSTGAIEYISSERFLKTSDKFVPSFDGLGYEKELDNGECLVYYYYIKS